MSLCIIGTPRRGGARSSAMALGPGPNAPAWAGKTVYTAEDFSVDLPTSGGANAAGFRAYQGFTGAFQNTSYPEVETPLGTKRVLRLTYPGQTESITAIDGTTTPWPFRGTEYSDAGVRISGTWSGTLIFERSPDSGESWIPMNVERTSDLASVVSTTVNGTFRATTGSSRELLRVRPSAWVSGTAIVSVGMAGGQAAARMDAGSYIANQGRIYNRIIFRCSSNFAMNGNTGTKFFFFRQEFGDNHYVNLGGNGSVGVGIAMQNSRPSEVARTPAASAGFTGALGAFHQLEFLAEANTPGSSNGTGRTYLDGVLCAERTDFQFFYIGDTPRFTQNFFDPTYGGGRNPPPEPMTLDIAYWYLESAA